MTPSAMDPSVLVEAALRPPLDDTRNDYESTPLGWARHGTDNSWHRAAGDYPATIDRLLNAGATR